ncbi:uncharacterized protein Z519_01713 [Cladophialophora bantiana CBS 173.52]|uniref:Myb-like DNA-binding domain-containing protein n=1 Tax=Cladophialophora bantiana (strain ATCC 10958 / CBS 173.52 / CDC B-1940 / NIH 8579) TaxID=1442370 RepID=A0A0D2IMX2_CLAB1|nr:uncharacterized protein Z519_01713 [Cladophialophora bantiana CBS 173.52]KIW98129.1 hypothetical protein Z519_01713 [Cladophialophora bantiana CBS 173.52]
MAPPFQADDTVLFLYHCLQNSNGKIDCNAVAVAMGSTRGAVEMRWRRLKKKIDGDTTPAQLAPPKSTRPSPAPNASQGKKNSRTRKRKMDADDEDDADDAGPPQVDGHVDVKPPSSRRRTRGRKLKYDIRACLSKEEDSTTITSAGSDEDYVADVEAIKSEDDELYMLDSGNDLKPKAKRSRKSRPLPPKARLAPTTTVAGRLQIGNLPYATQTKTAGQKVPPPNNADELRQKSLPVAEVKGTSSMHPSDRPLPSIEHSPQDTPLSGDFTFNKQGGADAGSDVSVESLKSEAFHTPSPEDRVQVSNGTVDRMLCKQNPSYSVVSATPTLSAISISTTADSTGRLLQQGLTDHVELRPQDSISNIGVRAELETINSSAVRPAHSSSTGFMGNTLQFLAGLLA